MHDLLEQRILDNWYWKTRNFSEGSNGAYSYVQALKYMYNNNIMCDFVYDELLVEFQFMDNHDLIEKYGYVNTHGYEHGYARTY